MIAPRRTNASLRVSVAIAASPNIVIKLTGAKSLWTATCRYGQLTCRYVRPTCRYAQATCRYAQVTRLHTSFTAP
jgi:hypothetical protein